MLEGLLPDIHELVRTYGYGAVFVGILLEDFGMPVPGETLLITAALLAGAGKLGIVPLLVMAWLGAVIGDNIGFALGHFGGRQLVLRHGGRVFITHERLVKVEDFFARHGGKIIVVARFVVLLRQLNGIVAGITGLSWWRFLAFNALGAALWVGFWGLLAYFMGSRFHEVMHLVKSGEPLAIAGVVVVVAGAIGFHFWHRRRRKKTTPR